MGTTNGPYVHIFDSYTIGIKNGGLCGLPDKSLKEMLLNTGSSTIT